MVKTKEEIDKLITSHKALIEAEARKYSKHVPYTYVVVEAYKLAKKAADQFDASRGFKFSTFLTNSLQKLSRISTQYGGTVRVPENKQFKIQKLNIAELALQDELGRDPTAQELSDHAGMSLPVINNLLKVRKKDVTVANLQFAPIFTEEADDDWIHFVYHDLAGKDKLIFEYVTGYAGKPKLSNNEIARKLGVSAATVSQRVKIILNKIKEGH